MCSKFLYLCLIEMGNNDYSFFNIMWSDSVCFSLFIAKTLSGTFLNVRKRLSLQCAALSLFILAGTYFREVWVWPEATSSKVRSSSSRNRGNNRYALDLDHAWRHLDLVFDAKTPLFCSIGFCSLSPLTYTALIPTWLPFLECSFQCSCSSCSITCFSQSWEHYKQLVWRKYKKYLKERTAILARYKEIYTNSRNLILLKG